MHNVQNRAQYANPSAWKLADAMESIKFYYFRIPSISVRCTYIYLSNYKLSTSKFQTL